MKILLIIAAVFVYIIIGLLLTVLSASNDETEPTPESLLVIVLWPIVFTGLIILFIALIIIGAINKIFKINIKL